MILYIKNHRFHTKKLLELINEFSKAAGYKINIQNLFLFLYTNNDYQKGKLTKHSHLQLPLKI